jgi:hypothetical protein
MVQDGGLHAGCAGAPRLFDLVRIKDDKLRPAFFYAMGNTLVAKWVVCVQVPVQVAEPLWWSQFQAMGQ